MDGYTSTTNSTRSSRSSTSRARPGGALIHTAGSTTTPVCPSSTWQTRDGERFIKDRLDPILEPMIAVATASGEDFAPPARRAGTSCTTLRRAEALGQLEAPPDVPDSRAADGGYGLEEPCIRRAASTEQACRARRAIGRDPAARRRPSSTITATRARRSHPALAPTHCSTVPGDRGGHQEHRAKLDELGWRISSTRKRHSASSGVRGGLMFPTSGRRRARGASLGVPRRGTPEARRCLVRRRPRRGSKRGAHGHASGCAWRPTLRFRWTRRRRPRTCRRRRASL